MSFENTLLISKSTSLAQTIEYIKKYSILGSEKQVVLDICESLKNEKNILLAVFEKVYSLVVYQPDPDDRQIIKSVEKLISTKKGNCVGYSTLIAAILLKLQIPFFYKVVSFGNANEMEHIYIVSGAYKLDCVIGHKQDGTDSFANRPKGKFNEEVKYTFSKYYHITSFEIAKILCDKKSRTKFARTRICQL